MTKAAADFTETAFTVTTAGPMLHRHEATTGRGMRNKSAASTMGHIMRLRRYRSQSIDTHSGAWI